MILTKQIERKTIVWLCKSNQYLLVENLLASILEQLAKGVLKEDIKAFLIDRFDVESFEAEKFIRDAEKLLKKPEQKNIQKPFLEIPNLFTYKKFYSIYSSVFCVEYFSEYELLLIHPKFAHLEVFEQSRLNYRYAVFCEKNKIYFYANKQFVGSWNKTESHYFQGKFYMKLIEHIYGYKEENWMGIFHASALSNGKYVILFLGDSGSGKSTALALLQTRGFDCLADDFVPVLAHNQNVYSFPSAISVKKNSIPVLLPFYAELKSAAEYHLKKQQKTVRYLPPKNANRPLHLPCKKLVFIKYKLEIGIDLRQISKIDAFQKLVPDSWLSPKAKSASVFLNWFKNLTCYQLLYSDNKKMIKTVEQLFLNEL
ncbi:MAG: hypothetical protein ACK5H1_10425 [Tenacibaculum sp.]